MAVVHFARRNHPNPVEAATSAMDGGLQAVSVPVNVGLPDDIRTSTAGARHAATCAPRVNSAHARPV